MQPVTPGSAVHPVVWGAIVISMVIIKQVLVVRRSWRNTKSFLVCQVFIVILKFFLTSDLSLFWDLCFLSHLWYCWSWFLTFVLCFDFDPGLTRLLIFIHLWPCLFFKLCFWTSVVPVCYSVSQNCVNKLSINCDGCGPQLCLTLVDRRNNKTDQK